MVSDAWKTSSGLIDNYTMTLDEVWFGKNKKYKDGKALLFMVRGEAIVDGEVVDPEKESYYSVGDGWDTDDGGESAAHQTAKHVNKQSNFGRFINAVIGLGEDVLAVIAERGDPTEASTWQGLTFRFESTDFSYTDKDTKEKVTYSVELPVEFIGEGDADEPAPKKKATAKKKSSAKSKAKAEAEVEDEGNDEEEAPPAKKSRRKASGNAALKKAVIAFASEYEDHADFMADVLDADEFDQSEELQADEELLNDVLDEDGSVWTEAQG